MPATADSLLYRLEGRFSDIKMIGPVPDGLRLNGHFGGPATSGKLAGAQITGVDYFRVRPDGVGVVDAREIMTVEGQPVAVEVHGYILPPEGMPVPTAEQMASPDFAWPDAEWPIEALASFETAAPGLAHLNRTIVAHTGGVNLAAGTLWVDVRRLDRAARPTAAVANGGQRAAR